MIVPSGRDAFTTADVVTISERHDNEARLSATAARNPKWLFERPDLFVSVKDERTETHNLVIMRMNQLRFLSEHYFEKVIVVVLIDSDWLRNSKRFDQIRNRIRVTNDKCVPVLGS